MDSHDATEPAVRGRWRSAIARSGTLAYERVRFFSDAVFAIAITLLIVDLRVPEVTTGGQVDAGEVLHDAIPKLIGFGVSFAVIGLFWLGHHAMFTYFTGVERALIAMNLLFLGCIAFLPWAVSHSCRSPPRCSAPHRTRGRPRSSMRSASPWRSQPGDGLVLRGV